MLSVLAFSMWKVLRYFVMCFLFSTVNVCRHIHKPGNSPDSYGNHFHKPGNSPDSYVLSVNGKQDNENHYFYEEGKEYIVKCERDEYHLLRWNVDQFGVATEKINATSISLRFKLDRYDDKLKITCVCDSDINKTLEFKLSQSQPKNAAPSLSTLELQEGAPRPNNCLILYGNETFTKYIKDSKNLNTNFKKTHNGLKLSCIQLNQNYEITDLIIKKNLINVTQIIPTSSEVTGQEEVVQVLKDQKEVGHHFNGGEENTSMESSTIFVLNVVGGTVAFIIVLFIVIMAFICVKKRRENNEPIYSEPLRVVYAELQINNENGAVPEREEPPYAKIVGVLKRKQSKRKSKSILPPRNNLKNSAKEELYAEVQHVGK